MALWGVSSSDFKNTCWNTVVGLGVAVGCGGVTFVTEKVTQTVLHYFFPKPTREQSNKFDEYGPWGVLFVGLGAAFAATMYIPGSRFALVTDPSIAKMLKLAVVQGLVGHALGSFFKIKPLFTLAGAGGALASGFSRSVLFGFGVVGVVLCLKDPK